jgi:hypothetical protein
MKQHQTQLKDDINQEDVTHQNLDASSVVEHATLVLTLNPFNYRDGFGSRAQSFKIVKAKARPKSQFTMRIFKARHQLRGLPGLIPIPSLHACVCMYVYIYMRMHVCMYIYIYIYTHTHITLPLFVCTSTYVG